MTITCEREQDTENLKECEREPDNIKIDNSKWEYQAWKIEKSKEMNDSLILYLDTYNPNDPNECKKALEVYKEYLQIQTQLRTLTDEVPEWNTYFGDNKLIGKSDYHIKNNIKLRKQDVKSRIKNVLGNKCMFCGKDSEITIHHKELCRIYQKDIPANSYISNIVLLCNECHINVHKCITANKRTNDYLKPYSKLPIYDEIFHKNVFETSNLNLYRSRFCDKGNGID